MTSPGAARFAHVLDRGLPDLPPTLTAGLSWPVAVWTGSRFGAVVVIEDCEHDPYCRADEHYVAMTYLFRREPTGWVVSDGAGGTDWPGGTLPTVSLPADEVQLDGGLAGLSSDWNSWKVEGFVGSVARWIELRENGETIRRPISPSGAFVVVLDHEPPADVRILDGRENVMGRYEFGQRP